MGVMLEHSCGFNKHERYDATDKPMRAVVADRPVNVTVTPDHHAARREDDKPPYRVPTMAEIAAVPWNGFKVASTFAGCGGSSLGYRMAGFRVVWANEFVDAARLVYELNARPGTILDGRDIRSVEPREILDAMGMAPGDLDVLDGSPPCASFSTAGIRSDGWGRVKKYSETAQRSDDLFFEYARILAGLKPKAFVAENVSGLVKGVAKGYFLEILRMLKDTGYRVEARVLDAQWLGVPQMRQRVIFIGFRDDLELVPRFPAPLAYRYSVRDAIPWLDARLTHGAGSCSRGKRGETLDSDAPVPTIAGGQGARASHQVYIDDPPAPDISRFAIGKEARNLVAGEQSDRYFNLQRAHGDEPSPTILAGHGQADRAGVIHPSEPRKFTIEELKRLCAFPDDFRLSGTYTQQWERLGRAVPPLMMRAVAEQVRAALQQQRPRAEAPTCGPVERDG